MDPFKDMYLGLGKKMIKIFFVIDMQSVRLIFFLFIRIICEARWLPK